MNETTGVKWERYDDHGGLIYRGNKFYVRVLGEPNSGRWLARVGSKLVADHYASDCTTAKWQAEAWIVEHESRGVRG